MAERATQNGWGPMVQVALEQRFPPDQRIVNDPLAYRFLPLYLKAIARVAGSNPLRERWLGLVDSKIPGVRGAVLCRKRAIDEKLAESRGRGLDAVVLFGAGMDTRACRLPPGAGVSAFEIDLPETVAVKTATIRRVLGQVPAHVHLLAADLERPDSGARLEAAGYKPGRRVFFIMEGVSQYVTERAVRGVLEATRSAGPGSWLAFTYIRRDFLEGRELHGLETLYRMTRVRRNTWRFGLEPDEVAEFITSFGWREVEQLGSAEYLERYVRPTGRDIPVMAVERLVFAEKI